MESNGKDARQDRGDSGDAFSVDEEVTTVTKSMRAARSAHHRALKKANDVLMLMRKSFHPPK